MRIRVKGSAVTQSSDATLSGLTASSSTSATGTFSSLNIGTFSSTTTSYTTTVANARTHVKLTPTANHASASISWRKGATGSFTSVTSGSATTAIALDEGANAITVRVTAQDSTTQDYTVTVTRQAQVSTVPTGRPELSGLSLSAGGSTVEVSCGTNWVGCRATVPHNTTTVTVTPTWTGTASKATVSSRELKHDGDELTAAQNVTSGGSVTVALASGLPYNAAGTEHRTLVNIDLIGSGSKNNHYTVTIYKEQTTTAVVSLSTGDMAGNSGVRRAATLPYNTNIPLSPTHAHGTAESLAVSRNPVAEGSDVLVTATLSSTLSTDVTIPLSLSPGTAEDGDYGSLSSITILAGFSSATGTITTNQDDDADDETFTVSLGSNLPSGVAAGTPSSVEVTITDDDVVSGEGGPGSGGGKYAALIAKMYEWRNDPQWVHQKEHTDRWDRALLAFGETVEDTSLTAMSAAEAQGYADRGWERWVEVAAAMWELEGGRPAVVTVTAGGGVTEGEPAAFTLTADTAPAADLAVTVSVSQSGDVADASALGERTVTIAAGSTSADFTVATVDDEADEEDGQVVAALSAGDGYTLGDAARATVAVADDEEDNPAILTDRAAAREGDDEAVVFNLQLDRAASHTVTVDYATADGAGVWAGTGTATAGVDYTRTSGTLTFAAGETSKSVSVPILDDVIDEGSEYFLLRFSNPQGATLDDSEVEGLIRNTDLIPGALLARFGRATAEQVVTQIEERMAAPRRRGFRARFAGRELRSGQEGDFALGFLTQLAQPMGMGSQAGPAPMGMGPHAGGAGNLGVSTAGMTGMGTPGGAMSMGGMPGATGGYGPAGGMHGGGLLGSIGMGGDLFSSSEFELNRESRGGMLSVWSRSSRSYFSGLEDALSLDGNVRTTMFGADYSRGALTVGLSVGRTLGLGGYRRDASAGRMTTSMTGLYPWVGYQVSDRVSVWGVTGYGTGALSLTPEGRSAMETGVSMAMSAAGTRGELIGARATGGFSLAFKADALWVGAASDLVDGAMGRLNASEAGVTRVRTALEGSRGFTLGRLSLTPSVEVGLRRDGGDAETGAGMDVGGGLAFTDAVTGLSLDVRVRTLVVHQAEGFAERGMSLSFGWDPTPSSPLGLNARVAPSWGGSAQGGAEALWHNQMAYGMGSHQMYGAGGQFNAEVGYGLPVGARFVGTPRVGLTTSQYGRDYRVGYGLGVLDRGNVNFELGVDAQRRESAMQGEASNGLMGRATLGW